MMNREHRREHPRGNECPIHLEAPTPEEQRRIAQIQEAMRRGLPLHRIEEILDSTENAQ